MTRTYPSPRTTPEHLEDIQQEILRWRMTQRLAEAKGDTKAAHEAERYVDRLLARWAALRVPS